VYNEISIERMSEQRAASALRTAATMDEGWPASYTEEP